MKALICGDISITDSNNELFAQGDVQALFTDTQSLFDRADVSIANLECALTNHDGAITKKGPPLKGCPETAKTLAKLGLTYCGLANNHFFDYGPRGARDTIAALTEAGVGVTGFGEDLADSRKDLVIERNGEKLCIIAVCEHEYSYATEERMGCRPFDEFDTPLDIRAAKAHCDRVIVMYHGGKEHCCYPSPRLRKACHAMAKSGADLILCQHSHCIGTYEQIDGCHILYGQGNFHFVKMAYAKDARWFECVAVMYDTQTNQVEFIPVTSSNGYGIRLADEKEGEQMLADFAQRNLSFEDGTWKDGWHAFCESMSDFYIRVVEKACVPGCEEKDLEQFRHYLDCEAHTDVWREIFPTWHRNGINHKQ